VEEGGWTGGPRLIRRVGKGAKRRAHHPSPSTLRDGGHATLCPPSYGELGVKTSDRSGLGLGRCEGGARSHAKRSATPVFRVKTGFRRFLQLTASPHIRSDRCPYPHSACLRRGSHEDETHLQNGCLLSPRVARSSSILHGAWRRVAAPVRWYCVYAFIVACSGTSPVVR
jgi:hypothetical protein